MSGSHGKEWTHTTIQNYKGSEILPHLQANSGVNHNSMDTSRRYETIGLDIKKALLSPKNKHPEPQHILCSLPKRQPPQGNTKRADENLLREEVVLQERNPGLREPESFLMRREDVFPLFWKEPSLLSSRAVCHANSFEKMIPKRSQYPLTRHAETHRPMENRLPTATRR